jgi:subtilisin family serine protease
VLVVVRRLRQLRQIAYAEPDFLMSASAAPNDLGFAMQWGDLNRGQAVPTQDQFELLGAPANGVPAADDRAVRAWDESTGRRSVVIGEVDTGVDYAHPDLQANIWSNPGGVGGCPAGSRGYNVLTGACDAMDDDTVYGGHGTAVAGIMGAVGDNSAGVAGMNWQTTILPVKWLDSSANGTTSGLITALQWLLSAKQAGVNIRVVNDSATFPGTAFSQALSEEIDTLGANDILFVTAAGNSGDDDDEEPVRRYPCGYDRPSEICVTASDNTDKLPSWANFGPRTVDLAAPGVSIYSTLRNGGYGYLSGGSFASPQVAGTAALILSVAPSLSATAVKAKILGHVDRIASLAGRVITGGRLDVCRAMPACPVAILSRPRIEPRAIHAGTGATLTYMDGRAALVDVSIRALLPGVQTAPHRCTAPPRRRGSSPGRPCVRRILLGELIHRDRAGRDEISITGRVGRRTLPPGSYDVRVAPAFAARPRGPSVSLRLLA